MRKKINLILCGLISCVFVGLNSIIVRAENPSGGWSDESETEIRIPSIGNVTAENADKVTNLDAPGWVNIVDPGMAGNTNEIVDNTINKKVSTEPMTEQERKQALENWYYTLFDDSKGEIITAGYSNGKVGFVLKSNMNTIPIKELVGGKWSNCNPDDIGAVRVENGKEWVETPTLLPYGYRIPGYTIDEVNEGTNKTINPNDSAYDIYNGICEKYGITPTGGKTPPTITKTEKSGEKVTRYKKGVKGRWLQKYCYKKWDDVWTAIEKKNPVYKWVVDGTPLWTPESEEELNELMTKILEMYKSADIDVISTTIYKEVSLENINIGEVKKSDPVEGTQVWAVYKKNEETGSWDYVDTYKSTRSDNSVSIYFEKEGQYLVKEFVSVKYTVAKTYHYSINQTLVLDDFDMIIGTLKTTDEYSTEQTSFQELEEVPHTNNIVNVTETSTWLISGSEVSSAAIIRRTQ